MMPGLDIRIMQSNPQLIEGVDPKGQLTVEQIYQFVLEQEIGTVVDYGMSRPYTEMDVERIAQSATVTTLMTVICLQTDDPCVLRLRVERKRAGSNII